MENTPVVKLKEFTPAVLSNHLNEIAKTNNLSDNLRKVLETSEKLKQIKSSDIKFSDPVIFQQDNPVFYPHTINVIQGQAGVHKSRLAEIICSAFLKRHNCENELLGYKRLDYEPSHCIIYVDTERNLSEQFPFALQSIQMKAGYEKADHPSYFNYISLLQIDRKDRFKTLNDYLDYVRETTSSPLFIVLDVSTDCIEDFNKTDKSMELIDLMNVAINDHNAIFLCLIHENPKSDKARGHFGTELMNKASTVMQVGFEKDASNEDTSIIRVKYLKCRSTARHAPFYIKFCEQEKGLVLANASDVSDLINSRKQKATASDMIEFIEMYLGDDSEMKRSELIDNLCREFKAKERTIESRLKEIIDGQKELFNNEGIPCILQKLQKDKVLYYSLKQNESTF